MVNVRLLIEVWDSSKNILNSPLDSPFRERLLKGLKKMNKKIHQYRSRPVEARRIYFYLASKKFICMCYLTSDKSPD